MKAGLANMFLAFTAAAATAHCQQPATAQPAPYQTEGLYFGRSGSTVTVELRQIQGASMDQVVLSAFGRVWTKPSPSRRSGVKSVADFTVPSVRVPTVFQVVPADKPTAAAVGELVAYPDTDVPWDKRIVLYSAGAPAWFDQWAMAVGLPISTFKPGAPATTQPACDDANAGALLIVGSASPGNDPAYAPAPVAETGIAVLNTLILDADWMRPSEPTAGILPAQMREPLTEIASQHWAQPLTFKERRRPWAGIANRWAWIAEANGVPLVEEVRPLPAEELRLLGPPNSPPMLSSQPMPVLAPRMLVSYVPWQQQLGRSESADATLVALLRAAATARPRECRWHPVRFVRHAAADASQSDCPVLAAVRSGSLYPQSPGGKPGYSEPIYGIVDLRGDRRISQTEPSLSEQCRGQLYGAPAACLLILGDDPILDAWDWLKLDRTKKIVNRPDATWLSDDELPPSGNSQIRLMLKLSELGVALGPQGKKEKPK